MNRYDYMGNNYNNNLFVRTRKYNKYNEAESRIIHKYQGTQTLIFSKLYQNKNLLLKAFILLLFVFWSIMKANLFKTDFTAYGQNLDIE